MNERTTSAQFLTIQSFKHTLTTYQTTKTCLSPFDDKRYLRTGVDGLIDGKTYAYGHFRIGLL